MFRKKSKMIMCDTCKNTFTEDEIVDEVKRKAANSIKLDM